jgi:hypothetical protein
MQKLIYVLNLNVIKLIQPKRPIKSTNVTQEIVQVERYRTTTDE